MSATFKVVSNKVGHNQPFGPDTRRVLQLLARADYLKESQATGQWSDAASTALQTFLKKAGFRPSSVIDPNEKSDILLALCMKANVVLEIDSDLRKSAAFLNFWSKINSLNMKYAWSGKPNCGEDKLVYGFFGYRNFLIFTNKNSYFDVGSDQYGMNCISFTNLALSIWRTGCAHDAPYDVSQAAGGFNPIANRYGMRCVNNPRFVPSSNNFEFGSTDLAHEVPTRPAPPIPLRPIQNPPAVAIQRSSPTAKFLDGFFYDASDVMQATASNQLYYLQWNYQAQALSNGNILPAGFGHHDTVLLNGDVYEINTTTPALRKTPLAARLKMAPGNAVRVMGPA